MIEQYPHQITLKQFKNIFMQSASTSSVNKSHFNNSKIRHKICLENWLIQKNVSCHFWHNWHSKDVIYIIATDKNQRLVAMMNPAVSKVSAKLKFDWVLSVEKFENKISYYHNSKYNFLVSS